MTTIDAAFEFQCFLFDDALCYDVPHPAKGFLKVAVSKLIVERNALRAALTEAQPVQPTRKALSDSDVEQMFDLLNRSAKTSVFSNANWFTAGVALAEAKHGIRTQK